MPISAHYNTTNQNLPNLEQLLGSLEDANFGTLYTSNQNLPNLEQLLGSLEDANFGTLYTTNQNLPSFGV